VSIKVDVSRVEGDFRVNLGIFMGMSGVGETLI
jgi:hypothetical protein